MKMKTRLLIIPIIAVMVVGGAIYASFENVDAGNINKGIGKTDVWEPGPEDGPVSIPEKMYDARLVTEYRNSNPITHKNNVTNDQLKEKLELVRNARIGIVSSGIDYDIGQLVFYAPDFTIEQDIKNILGNFPFVLLYEEQSPLRNLDRFDPTESDINENDTVSENKKPYTVYNISGVKQIYRIGEPISFTETVQGYANPCVFPYYKILDANTLETVWQYKIVYPCPFIKDPQQFKIINTIPNDDILSPILNQTGHYILRSYHSYSDEYEDVTFSVIDESSGEKENEN
jgi:hypothetical protein